MVVHNPTVLTVILNYRTPEMSLRSLDAAYRAMEGIAGEIVVVDNGSATVPQVPDWVRLVTETTPGAANARNRGVAETRADRFFFVDSDCLPAPDWIAAARRACDRADHRGPPVALYSSSSAGARCERVRLVTNPVWEPKSVWRPAETELPLKSRSRTGDATGAPGDLAGSVPRASRGSTL